MNFAGPVALTRGLLPGLRRTHGRGINIVSSAFKMAKGDPFADLSLEAGYVGIKAYARAKWLNLLWTRALATREPDITVYAVNPGMAWTPSTQALTPAAVPAWRLVWPIVRWFQRRASAEKAATTPLRGRHSAQPGPQRHLHQRQGQTGATPRRLLRRLTARPGLGPWRDTRGPGTRRSTRP
jgi:NAD(P)-dependent dehydrogenase (short-subunit alcohol dehydrogenase family)